MGITENLAKILNAVHGRDVRQAIHDSIQDCYNDGHVTDVSDIEDSIESINGSITDILGDISSMNTTIGNTAVNYINASASERYTLKMVHNLAIIVAKRDTRYGICAVDFWGGVNWIIDNNVSSYFNITSTSSSRVITLQRTSTTLTIPCVVLGVNSIIAG